MAAKDVERQLVKLVQLLEREHDQVPERILLRPRGREEVNAQVTLTGEKWPVVYFVPLPQESAS